MKQGFVKAASATPAIPVHRGRTSHVWNVDITTPEGKLVSTARIVNLIVKKRL